MSSWWVEVAAAGFGQRAQLEQPRMQRELDALEYADDDEDTARLWLTSGEYEQALETLIAEELKDRGVL